MNDKSLTWKENLLLISIFTLALFSYWYNKKYIILLIAYIVLITVNGNARRIWLKNKDIARILRRFFFILPLYLTLFIGFSIEFNIRILLFSLIGIIFVLFLTFLNFRSWRFILNKDVILSQNSLSIPNCASRTVYLIFTAIGEELFFRNFFLLISTPNNKLYMIFISALCFITVHVNNKTREIQKFDIFLEAIFSIFSGFLYVLSNSCLPSIIAHISFNFPYALIDIKYIYYKCKERQQYG